VLLHIFDRSVTADLPVFLGTQASVAISGRTCDSHSRFESGVVHFSVMDCVSDDTSATRTHGHERLRGAPIGQASGDTATIELVFQKRPVPNEPSHLENGIEGNGFDIMCIFSKC
jgi:hypothetical protein